MTPETEIEQLVADEMEGVRSEAKRKKDCPPTDHFEANRAERAALIITTNLPFSECTTVFPNPRLCKALLDRITDRAHIIETGTESFRFRRTMERRKKA
jgi:hypothetical protein